ncbi:hypothetical protein DACRYDRAFT_113366 [Dacryopinax primogenitus]|uniref:N-acetyltransferase domain-containing protein n=1 Tax=Dacryopinax primogenitus (strain DJM 731) TaxID=1858805 RepID=M5G8Y2_DACPD|nr:uncharacterized protein DACRYDRAFT_113366 [Dacryopinax primogenitus]EJU05179.1 hypothetical protein DACRYDRAFT_113366 [Dacryopinax primogenitus]
MMVSQGGRGKDTNTSWIALRILEEQEHLTRTDRRDIQFTMSSVPSVEAASSSSTPASVPEPEISIRRLLSPTPSEVQAALEVLRISFSKSAFFAAILGGNVSPERMAAAHELFLRAALVRGEGEVWIAESFFPEEPEKKEVVGAVLWFLPGTEFLATEKQRKAARWEEFARMLGVQSRWLTDYYLPRIDAFWTRALPYGPSHLESYELCKLAVLPNSHNAGIASLLVWPVLSRAVREGKRVVGETTSEGNVSKYLRVGGQQVGEERFYAFDARGRPTEEGEPAFRIWGLEFQLGQVGNGHWSRTNERDEQNEKGITRACL